MCAVLVCTCVRLPQQAEEAGSLHPVQARSFSGGGETEEAAEI